MALLNRKLTYAKGVPKNFGSKQNKIQKKQRSLLFPDLQETSDASADLEFMKIKLSNLGRLREGKPREFEERERESFRERKFFRSIGGLESPLM